MTTFDLVSTWVRLDPQERESIRIAYFPSARLDRPVPPVAAFARPLSTAMRRIGQALQDSWSAEPALPPAPLRAVGEGRPSASRCTSALTPFPLDAGWRWDTADEQMWWSPGLFSLYGYRPGSLTPTIWRHQDHKAPADRARVEQLILSGASRSGPLTVPQRLVTVDGDVRDVVVHVRREPGEREVLTGVVLDAGAATG